MKNKNYRVFYDGLVVLVNEGVFHRMNLFPDSNVDERTFRAILKGNMEEYKKKETRGGPGRNQGLKAGTKHKNNAKLPENRHSVKRFVSYTPLQGKLFEEAANKVHETPCEFQRKATLTRSLNVLKEERNEDK